MKFRVEQALLACCLSAVGLSVVSLRLLARPSSWLSRRVDRAVELPARARSSR